MNTMLWLENPKVRDHSQDLRIDKRIMSGWEVVDWMHLVQGKDQ
jgi:hypothetical protein